MRPIDNWENIEEAGTSLPALEVKPGAYIVKILKVEDIQDKEYLKIYFDFYDGEYKGACEKYKKDNGEYPHAGSFIRSYKDTATRFFKAFITAVEKSNARTNYRWNWDERTLEGKYFVAVFGEEEFEKNDGTIGVSCKCVDARSIEALKNKEIKVPSLKKLKSKSTNNSGGTVPAKQNDDFGGFNINDDDLPF